MRRLLLIVLLLLISGPARADDILYGIFKGVIQNCSHPTDIGQLRYNSTTSKVQLCNGTSWTDLGAAGSSGTPTISSCGTGSSVTGTDNSFLLTTASAGLGTGTNKCVVNFGAAWTAAPSSCVITAANIHASDDISGWYISTISTTQFGLGLTPASGGSTGGDAFYVQCNP